MIYLVTGASGFIGKRLVRIVLARREAIVHFPMRDPTPERVATQLGIFGQVMHAVMPRLTQIINNSTFRMFPDSEGSRSAAPGEEMPTADRIAMTRIMRGLHQ